jgi:hypothetical protein
LLRCHLCCCKQACCCTLSWTPRDLPGLKTYSTAQNCTLAEGVHADLRNADRRPRTCTFGSSFVSHLYTRIVHRAPSENACAERQAPSDTKTRLVAIDGGALSWVFWLGREKTRALRQCLIPSHTLDRCFYYSPTHAVLILAFNTRAHSTHTAATIVVPRRRILPHAHTTIIMQVEKEGCLLRMSARF